MLRPKDAGSPARRGLRVLAVLVIAALAAGAAAALIQPSDAPAGTAQSPPNRIAEARAALDKRDRARAEALLREHVSARPESVEARLLLARLLREKGRPDEAREQYAAVVKADPKNDEARQGLAATPRDPRSVPAATPRRPGLEPPDPRPPDPRSLYKRPETPSLTPTPAPGKSPVPGEPR